MGSLLALYWLAPDFYLTYILERERREYQAVEILTFVFSLVAGAVLLPQAWRVWRHRATHGGPAGVAGFLFLLGLASLFYAGEEVNWGETFLRWGYTERQKSQLFGPASLHNLDLPVSLQSLGVVLLVICFVVVPVASRLLMRGRPLGRWGLVVAGGPVICVLMLALVWPSLLEAVAVPGSAFAREFVDQVREQKELLIGLALLLFSLDPNRRRAADSYAPTVERAASNSAGAVSG